MTDSMSKEEFVELLITMSRQARDGCVLAARIPEDVGEEDDVDAWASLLQPVSGELHVDDSDEEPTRNNGITSTRLYKLSEIDTWPEGLFEKLSSYIWWIEDHNRIPVLDVLAATPEVQDQV